MLEIRVGPVSAAGAVLALPVRPGEPGPVIDVPVSEPFATEAATFLAEVEHSGEGGTMHHLPRPGREPSHVLFVGIGDGDERGWRLAGAAVARAAVRYESVTVQLPTGSTAADEVTAVAVAALAEGAWLASYRFRLAADSRDDSRKLRQIVLATDSPAAPGALRRAKAIAEATLFARDLTNTPSDQKSPAWLADRIAAQAAGRRGVTVKVLDEVALAQGGFGGILAVGAGSTRPPRLVELAWRPRGARRHVVLVGKGITFDTGGISIKSPEGMKLMRKDMGGAAAVCAATLGAAALGLPVRVTAIAPLAENMISGSAFRPGDVVRHFGGRTTEVQNTDGEGRVVLGDALAYAARKFSPDYLVDLATLTGASHIALGKRTAALYTHDDALAQALFAAGAQVGEQIWRMPLFDEYLPLLASTVADLNNAPAGGRAGSALAALFLREFTGGLRDTWAHLDMSAPAWIETNDGPLVRGATGWGARLLLRWLATL